MKKGKQLLIAGALSVSWGILIAFFITGHLWDIENIRVNLANLRIWTSLNRAFLLALFLWFISLHFIFPIKKIYNTLFDKRWLVGIAVLLFLTINQYHGDSITYYYDVIQPGIGSEASQPIFGEERSIRSDEFLVSTPSTLASRYGDDPFGKYNNIMRGTETLNSISGVYAGYPTLAASPFKLIFLVLPVEYAFSFYWYAPLVFCFLINIEIFFIISKKRKLLSAAGAFLVVFSSFYLWWGFTMTIASSAGTVVCIYYFINNKSYLKKLLFGIGTALCFSNFVVNLYPAWQVPLGYMFLAIGLWVLHDNWDKIKVLRKKEWAIVGICICFMISLIASYFISISEYTNAVTNTVYPGARIDSGSWGLDKLFYYAQAPFYAYKDIGNASEAGVFFSLFPIPTLMACYCWIKCKTKDWLTGGLLIAQLPMLIYLTVGFPEILAKILLFSNSTTIRTADIVGLIQVYFIVIVLSRYANIKKLNVVIGIFIAVVVAGASIYISNRHYPEYLTFAEKLVMFIVIAGICLGLLVNLRKQWEVALLSILITISIITGIYIRPLMKSLDAIYSKPVAGEIQKICEKDTTAKWLTYGAGHVTSAFAVACGASTINSVNVYPNMDLWEKLDESGKYEEIYNRYAHVNVEFVEEDTNFKLFNEQPDYIQLNLSYKDIEKT